MYNKTNNMTSKMCRRLVFFLISIILLSCSKYLDERPDKNLVVPAKMQDLQSLLDANFIMNMSSSLGEEGADNYYLKESDWASLNKDDDKNIYIWGKTTFDALPNDWSRLCQVIYNANIVLEHLEKIGRREKNKLEWDNIRGSALFFRSLAFHKMAIIWSGSYDSATASEDIGIPLRLTSDFNKVSVRSNLKDTYLRIINDLKGCIPLLPVTPVHVMRPSRPAAYALLARVYLSMGVYDMAKRYADSCLELFPVLLDYNTLNATSTYPIPQFNPEVIFHSIVAMPQNLNNSRAIIDSVLYRSYENDDLRRSLFFKRNEDGTYGFKGSYNGSWVLFTGIAADEMYITRAECYARQGNIDAAMNDLNTLLAKRWKEGAFEPSKENTANDALEKILVERRKELLMRGLRWMDLKRLNKEGMHQMTIVRKINGKIYTLKPNDPGYVFLIPRTVIDLSGMPQNIRN